MSLLDQMTRSSCHPLPAALAPPSSQIWLSSSKGWLRMLSAVSLEPCNHFAQLLP